MTGALTAVVRDGSSAALAWLRVRRAARRTEISIDEQLRREIESARWAAHIAARDAAEGECARLQAVLRELDRVAETTYWDDPSAGVQAIARAALGEGCPE